jgi:hypothetical protein
MARHDDNDTPPANVTHGALRYVRSQRHLNGQDRTAARGGRDDVAPFEQETWRGRDQRMREMHSGSGTPNAVSGNTSEASGNTSEASGATAEQTGRGSKRSFDDQRVREEVCELLTVHDYVDASEIEVDVKEGVVTLTGTVASRAQRRAAEDALFSVEGVVDVINQLRVLPREVSAPFER